MAEAQSQSDQSMEEILQSIKRIIAEEGEESTPSPSAANSAEDDILELTQMVTEDQASQSETPPMSVDALLDALADAPSELSAAEPIVQVVEPATEDFSLAEEPVPAPPVAEAFTSPANAVEEEAIASAGTLAASAAALRQLKQPEPTPPADAYAKADRVFFRSGQTVEDLVLEALRPMLREWVDGNMPGMVERMVAREIAKIRAQMG